MEQTHIEAIVLVTQADVDNGYWEHEVLLQKAEAIARSLPEPTCTVLRFCYWEKKTYQQVAEQLGISPDTVKKHISKALRMLREEMKDSLSFRAKRRRVVEPKAKNLGNINVDEHEILPPFGHLNDK